MTVASQASTPATFEIKSASLPLVALLLKSTDLEQLARELAQRFGSEPDFFDQDALMIDLAPLQATQARGIVDFAALMALLSHYQLVPVAVKGGSPPQMMAALQAGLLPVPDAHLVSNAPNAQPRAATRPPAPAPAPVAPVAPHAAAAPPHASPPPPRPSRCAQASKSMRADATWWCWLWSTPVPRSLPTATFMFTRRCAARPWPARVATSMQEFLRLN